MVRAAIYARVSTEDQEREGFSLKGQVAKCRDFALGQGWTIVGEYAEQFSSMTIFRPKLTQLRELIQVKQLDVVVVADADRLSRDPKHWAFLEIEAVNGGCQYHYLANPPDDSLPGQIMAIINAHGARSERTKIMARTQAGIKARAQSGLMPGFGGPYGYVWREPDPTDPKRKRRTALDIDPVTAPIVQRIFRELASGKSARSIARTLNAEGVPTTRNASRGWSPRTIIGFARNPAYLGEAYAFRYSRKYAKQMAPKDEWLALPEGTIPPLVTPAVFEMANQTIAGNRGGSHKNPNPESFLLRGGFIYCGLCGGMMVCRNEKDKCRYVHCGPHDPDHNPRCTSRLSIMQPMVDDFAWSRVLQVIQHPRFIERFTDRLEQGDDLGGELRQAQDHLATVGRRVANTQAMMGDAETADQRKFILAELSRVSAEREAAAIRLTDVLALHNSRTHARAAVESFAERVRQRWGQIRDFTYQERREALQQLGVKVSIRPKNDGARITVDMAFNLGKLPTKPGDQSNGMLGFVPVYSLSELNGRSVTQPSGSVQRQISPVRWSMP